MLAAKTIGHAGAGINWTRVAFSRVSRVFVLVPLRPSRARVAFFVQAVRVQAIMAHVGPCSAFCFSPWACSRSVFRWPELDALLCLLTVGVVGVGGFR